MNILVTGAGGQLGREMQIVSRETADRYIFTDVCEGYERLDITDLGAVRAFVKANAVDVIVNCAAWTDVDGAEDPEKYALVERLNATAPENLATSMKEVGGLLVHISTDYVFGKEPYNTPCSEDRTGTPTGIYGLTKLHGEQKIRATLCRHVIIRTAWLYSEFGRNFCKTMLALTANKPEIKVVFDQVGTPTYALDLAEAITAILRQYESCTERESLAFCTNYNYSNEGVCSWYDFAMAVKEFAGHECNIKPCHSEDFPSKVTRPSYSVLDKTKIKETFGVAVPYWTDSLRKCILNIRG